MIVMGFKWRRKLQKVSNYSRYVALPKFWIINNHLEGPEAAVRIESKGSGTLIITPFHENEEGKNDNR